MSAQPLRGLSVSRYLHVVYLSILPPRGLSVSRTSTWSICKPYLHVVYLEAGICELDRVEGLNVSAAGPAIQIRIQLQPEVS